MPGRGHGVPVGCRRDEAVADTDARGFLNRVHKDKDGKEVKYVLFVPHDYRAQGRRSRHPVPARLRRERQRRQEAGQAGHRPGHQEAGEDLPVHRDLSAVAEADLVGKRRRRQRALAILDEVQKEYKTDPKRIYLTGLSMGGFGTWSMAATYPDKWAAIVPICGGGDPKTAEKIKNIPCWCFHGDADTAVAVDRSRTMIEALKKAGGNRNTPSIPASATTLGQGVRHGGTVRLAGETRTEMTHPSPPLGGGPLNPPPSGTWVPNGGLPMPSNVDRRDFLKTTAAGAAALTLTAASRQAASTAPTNASASPSSASAAAASSTSTSSSSMQRENEGRRARRRLRRLGRRRSKLGSRHSGRGPVSLGQASCGLNADDKTARHQGLSPAARTAGSRRRLHRHAGPLARQDVDRRRRGRQGRLLRKADDQDDRRGPRRRRCRCRSTTAS